MPEHEYLYNPLLLLCYFYWNLTFEAKDGAYQHFFGATHFKLMQQIPDSYKLS